MKTAVYVIDKSYYIMWNTERESLGWVRIGDREYHEEVSGILLSGTVHRIKVPCRELDKYGEYTVCTAVMKKRSSYFSETETAEEETIKFKPVCGGRPVNIYMVADTHSVIDTPVEAGGYFGDKLDLVIMNGDIMDTSEDISSWKIFFELSYELTRGSIPIVSSRGNHDTRGVFAPYLGNYCPSRNGDFFYTFTMGDIWGIVLDCGEDKTDDHPEYGGTVRFADYRRRETEYLKDILKEGEWRGFKHRIAVCHIQLNIATNVYDGSVFDEWTAILNDMGIELMLCGHDHKYEFIQKGSSCFDGTSADFPIVVGAKASGNPNTEHKHEPRNYIGTALTIDGKNIKVMFTDCKHNIIEEHDWISDEERI